MTDGLLWNIYSAFNQNRIIKCIRESMLMVTPVILIGAFSLLAITLPIPALDYFVKNFAGGILVNLMQSLYNVTLNILSVYLTICVAVRYSRNIAPSVRDYFGPVFNALCGFFILSGSFVTKDYSSFGVTGIFIAMFSGLVAAHLYHVIYNSSYMQKFGYNYCSDIAVRNIFKMFTPSIITTLLFLLFNALVVIVGGFDSFHDMYTHAINYAFADMRREASSMLSYIIVTHLLWFMGIHGTNALHGVADDVFDPALLINQHLISQGLAPYELYSYPFWNVFITMGGCGTTVCLLISLLLYSNRSRSRDLAKFAILPGIFNINEILVFGIPVIFNPILLIPFITVPLLCFSTATIAMTVGWIPPASYDIWWTTPIFLSGYAATGSIGGALVQLFNLVLGVWIYKPFVVLLDKEYNSASMHRLEEMKNLIKESRNTWEEVTFLDRQDVLGEAAREKAYELSRDIDKPRYKFFYQPQFDNHRKCIGAEAVMIYPDTNGDNIYQPLITQLIKEGGIAWEFEKNKLYMFLRDVNRLIRTMGPHSVFTTNLTIDTVLSEELFQFLRAIRENHPQLPKHIMIQIKEQETPRLISVNLVKLRRLHNLGYKLGINSFRMRNVNHEIMDSGIFQRITISSTITAAILKEENIMKTVVGIGNMVKNYPMIDLAGMSVTSDTQKNLLEVKGFNIYQGSLYSEPLPIERLEDFLRNK